MHPKNKIYIDDVYIQKQRHALLPPLSVKPRRCGWVGLFCTQWLYAHTHIKNGDWKIQKVWVGYLGSHQGTKG